MTELIVIPEDCLYEIFLRLSQKDKCRFGKTCLLLHKIKDKYTKTYLMREYPLVWKYIDVVDYHEAIFRLVILHHRCNI